MARQPRIKYTEELKAEIWRKYKQGESLWPIARSLNRSSSSIYRQLAPTGGIPPAVRKRSRLPGVTRGHLSQPLCGRPVVP
jgi:transposase-like protein